MCNEDLVNVALETILAENGRNVGKDSLLSECYLDSLGYLTVWLAIDELVVANGFDSILTDVFIYDIEYNKCTVDGLCRLVFERSCNEGRDK